MLLFPFTDFCENFGVIYLLCVIKVVSYLFVSNFEREIDARPANTDLLAHAQHFTAELIDVSFLYHCCIDFSRYAPHQRAKRGL